MRPVPSRAEYLASWSDLHGGYDPAGSRFVGPWLSLVYLCARPFAAAHVPPDLLTGLGLALAGLVAWVAGVGGPWLFLCVVLVVASGLVDSLDGAVAVLTGRATAFGAVLDSVADRCSDLLYLVALWAVGAPVAMCVLGGALMMLLEYTRARATAGGMTEIGVVTVWERPTRVVVTGAFLLGAAIYRGWSAASSAAWVSWAAWVWVGLGLVGLVQLLLVVRRRLS